MSEDQNFVLEQIAKKVYSLSAKRNVRSAVWSILSEVIKDDGVPHRSSSKWNESSAGHIGSTSAGVSANYRARKRGQNKQQRKRNVSHTDDNGSACHDEDSYDYNNEHKNDDNDDDDEYDGDRNDYVAAKKRRCQTSTDRETENECVLIGKRMATHFRNMLPDQRLYAERIISEVLVYGRMNRLTIETRFMPDN
ncbi:uncharacterized protein Dwil_GK25603 [Drosophila willistoni]|uniref:MADF domain-containing protein n=1 Tax=Drosophila willistoni TaxID=7260 RepID=B4NE92_DROWI|nr:uncharacterized protein Dwil_GK25603 [Drosophila willistoni]